MQKNRKYLGGLKGVGGFIVLFIVSDFYTMSSCLDKLNVFVFSTFM